MTRRGRSTRDFFLIGGDNVRMAASPAREGSEGGFEGVIFKLANVFTGV